MPPPYPGPTPGPRPLPTPPPLPLPIPPPEPVPLEGGPSTLESGSPSGPVVGSVILGGTTTVGSTGSCGFSLRTTTIGGVICWSESLGSAPLEACSLSRSPPPPPPPPPALVAEGGSTYGLMSVT